MQLSASERYDSLDAKLMIEALVVRTPSLPLPQLVLLSFLFLSSLPSFHPFFHSFFSLFLSLSCEQSFSAEGTCNVSAEVVDKC